MSDRSDRVRAPEPAQRVTEPRGSRTERVLLLLQSGGDRERFAERLDAYDLVVGDPGESLPSFDLCMVDTATYPAVAEALAELKAETGTYLPVLLVVGPDECPGAARESAGVADDMLSLPTTELTLQSRVEALLRARRGSLQLDAERERFRTLAETAPSAILTIDVDGVVQYANPAVEAVFGYPPEEVVGEPLTMLMPPGLRQPYRAGLSRYLDEGERSLDWTGTRLPGRHADGHDVTLLVAFAEHRVGEERRFTGIIQDISERVERERELERTVDLYDRTQAIADVGGWEVDAETLDVLWTEQVYEILGLPPTDEPPLEEAFDLYHPDDRPTIEAAIEAALTDAEPFDEDLRVQRPDGELRWVRVLGKPVTVGGEVDAVRGTFQDITERRERRADLERAVDLLGRTGEIAGVGGFENNFETGEVVWTEQTYEILDLPPTYEPDTDDLSGFYHPEDWPQVEAGIEQVLETGEPFDLEVRIATGADREKWVRIRGEPAGEDDELLRGTVHDITDRKERERELERYETVLEAVPEAAWIFDEDLELVFVDSSAATALGTTPAALVGEPVSAFRGPIFRDPAAYDRYVESLEAVLAGERESAEVVTEIRLDDRSVVVEIGLAPVRRNGDVEGVVALARDVTAREERERELERAVDMLDRAEDIADVGGWQYDPETGELLWTDQVARIHGVDPDRRPDVDEAIERYHPDDRPVIREALDRAVEDGEPYDLELRITRPDGEQRWVRTIGEPETVEGRQVVRGAFQDITERKERERELERTVEQLRQTRDIADVSGWEYDTRSEEIWWDEKVHDIYGQPASFEPTAESVFALYEPRSRERMQAVMRRAIVDSEPFDVEIRLATEPTRWVRVTGTPRTEDGRVTSVRGVVRDITGRKRREAFLERYERIVETSSEPIYTLDGRLRFTLVNEAVADLFGRDRAALPGEHVAAVFGEAHAEALGDVATQLYAKGEDQTMVVETVVPDADGRSRRYQTAISPQFEAGELRGLVCVSHDVTDVTEHERRLSVLDRVLRHNLRNKMNVVLAQARSVRETAADGELVETAASIEQAAEELLELGQTARKFHNALDPGDREFVRTEDVAAHARDVVEAARHSYEGVTLTADVPATAPAMAHAEFELALSELVDNAATHGGAETTVAVEVETTDDEVFVRVLDDGPGMPELERRALSVGWESPLQHATGLGLWFVQWTVTNSGGTMCIRDRDGGGTVVELCLPAANPDESAG